MQCGLDVASNLDEAIGGTLSVGMGIEGLE